MSDKITMSRPEGRDAKRVLDAEMLAAFRHFAQTMTEFTERLAGQAINHTLEVFAGTFDATGQITRDYNVAAGAITVNNLGAAGHIITVSSAGPGAGAPPGGTGVYFVDGGTTRTIPLASRVFTLYGTNADKVSFSVYTAAAQPVSP